MADEADSVCGDCGLPVVTFRPTRGARVGPMECGAHYSEYYELRCKRVAVALLRAKVEEATGERVKLRPGDFEKLLALYISQHEAEVAEVEAKRNA